ncbi:hypothetical protein [Clostridium botulinum]|uniref:hypothetical protein n=1 Tax=Clostridium botulinum TaxID=1491 RepID=UPI000E0EE2D0|nr:hypothetical protein [Clostridium sporogenes]
MECKVYKGIIYTQEKHTEKYDTIETVGRKVRNTSHSVVKHTRSFVKNHRRAIEITRNVVAIASIALIAIPLVAPVAIPAMAIAALGIVEVGLDLAVGDNTSAAVGLLFLFPMSKGFKYVTEIGGDAIKGGSKAKNLYKFTSKGIAKATKNNYRKMFLKEFPYLPKGYQVHHTLPQKYDSIMKKLGINVHELKYLKGVDKEVHKLITKEWMKWDKGLGRSATVQEVIDFAKQIHDKYNKYWLNK